MVLKCTMIGLLSFLLFQKNELLKFGILSLCFIVNFDFYDE